MDGKQKILRGHTRRRFLAAEKSQRFKFREPLFVIHFENGLIFRENPYIIRDCII